MADIIPEEILVKGKRPETFSGGLYGLGGAPGGGGTSGTGIWGLYGLAGPGSYAKLAGLEADAEFRMQGVKAASPEAVRNIPEEKLVAMLNAGEISPQQVADAYGVTVTDVNNSLADINMQASLAPANTGVETGTPSAEAEALTALGEEISELVSTIANSETAT